VCVCVCVCARACVRACTCALVNESSERVTLSPHFKVMLCNKATVSLHVQCIIVTENVHGIRLLCNN